MPLRASLCLQAQMLREGRISPTELTELHLRRIDSVNPQINAFVYVFAEKALSDARRAEAAMKRGEPLGLLHGLPLTVKDSFDIEGVPTCTGSRLRDPRPAGRDAAVVARMRRAGAILLGKTNTPELLGHYETDNFVTGRTNNPWDTERTPGGSSGGEAAAISSFCSAGGVGSDGGGSIRIPAHFCGIAGLKPTPGRIPVTGHFPAISSPGGFVSVAGPMARTAKDVRLLFAAMAGYKPEDPFSVPVPVRPPNTSGVRVGVWPGFYDVPVTAAIARSVESAARLLNEIGLPAEPFTPTGLDRAPNLWWFIFGELPGSLLRQFYEGRENEAHWTATEFAPKADMPPRVEDVMTKFAARDRMRAKLLRQMEKYPVLLTPVCAMPAFRHRQREFEVIAGHSLNMFQAMMTATIWNVLGFPAVTVPFGMSEDGLPVGVQLVGRPWEDETLLDIAVRLEEARGPLPHPPAFS